MAKGGTSNLVEVYEYAEPVTAKGLVFMDTPGYDPIAVTGQIAGGQIYCVSPRAVVLHLAVSPLRVLN
ncbi:UxaA family hydrolase [Yersinia intermedia]|nr:UxaA family hydrolase [Yersinia intermedia]